MSWSSRRGCCVYFMERSFPAPLPALLSVPARISGPSVKHHQSPQTGQASRAAWSQVRHQQEHPEEGARFLRKQSSSKGGCAVHTFQGAATNPLEKMKWRIRVIPSVIPEKSEQGATVLFSHNTPQAGGSLCIRIWDKAALGIVL